ncbi:unnamed protein product [Linum tenue]|uniref:E2 ubiquitin-conjugating enzyme n=1 Tax=Linum tenue TaxID=586396 RepID=A0AAV0HXE9_9ROSI|nr:unnamed protein product [Linum tenue]
MAQAARLSLRLQRELKLLLSDPPPSTTFPFLSGGSDLSSLTTIEAHMEGPEGTVYAKGTFKIKIQVPERYPFQPPVVTFATPIYHPNIDTGGRICLDILNLPPKGAWQPSLNISTVITSIMLLLSEPNPDDGLMCEASREYKYNRQAFDQKARAMTEKHARSGVGEQNLGNQSAHVHTDLTKMVAEGVKSESKVESVVGVPSDNTPSMISKKLSLEASTSSCHERDNDRGTNEVLKDESFMQKPAKASYGGALKGNSDINAARRYNKLSMSRSKLSIVTKDENASMDALESKHLQSAEQNPPPSLPMPSTWPHSNLSTGSSASSMSLHGANVDSKEVCKKASYVGKKLSLGHKGSSSLSRKTADKENIKPMETLLSSGQQSPRRKSTSSGRKPSLVPLTQLQQESNVANSHTCLPLQNRSDEVLTKSKSSCPEHGDRIACDTRHCGQEESLPPATDSIIVLDSEDSEEETGLTRPTLRLRMLKRRKSQA